VGARSGENQIGPFEFYEFTLLIEEYLHTSYENPDPEYKDGELLERSFADNAHSTAMGRVSNIFWDLSESRPFHGRISMRCRVSATRIRVPDVCVYAGKEPTGPVRNDAKAG
jgi:Uma2 family endonuclease